MACAVAVVCASAPAAALRAAPMSSRAAVASRHVGGRPDPPVISRWETDEGGGFVLDLSMPHPLLKFDDSNEIWVLNPSPGPRGDVIYRNDLGEEVLRATRLGGMTVFTSTRPDGSAAALDGISTPLRVAALNAEALYRRFLVATLRASRAAQHQVSFETGADAEPATAPLFADAALVTSEAFVDMASRPINKGLLARINGVTITQGSRPNVALAKGVLTVTLVPAAGLAGRPSSRWIERAVGAR
ncbi:MAG TPA: DUF4908 domain-containing protein [Caulobacteraceae bacterium]|nr:DUF4908 domain-containing protein [Caulobacteraceae bacterium]